MNNYQYSQFYPFHGKWKIGNYSYILTLRNNVFFVVLWLFKKFMFSQLLLNWLEFMQIIIDTSVPQTIFYTILMRDFHDNWQLDWAICKIRNFMLLF
jgi:hypothetical protein